jgi:hypothetical protein
VDPTSCVQAEEELIVQIDADDHRDVDAGDVSAERVLALPTVL